MPLRGGFPMALIPSITERPGSQGGRRGRRSGAAGGRAGEDGAPGVWVMDYGGWGGLSHLECNNELGKIFKHSQDISQRKSLICQKCICACFNELLVVVGGCVKRVDLSFPRTKKYTFKILARDGHKLLQFTLVIAFLYF